MKGKSLRFALAFLLVLSFAFVYPAWAAERVPYKVGASLEISGPASFLGEPARNTLTMLEEKINKGGGINGHPLKLIIYDNASDSTKHVMALKRLIEQDEVAAIIGPMASGNSLAGNPILEKAAVPSISLAASNKIIDPVKKWIFMTPKTDTMNITKLLTHAKGLGFSKAALLHSDSGYGMSGKEQFEIIAPKLGFTIAAMESFGDKDSDMTTQLTKIRASGAEAIVVYSASPAGSIIVKNWKQLGMTAKLYHSLGWASQDYIDLAGDAANGVLLCAGRMLVLDQIQKSSPYKPVLETYKKDYEEKYKMKFNEFGGHAWDALMLIANSMKKVGADRAKIRENIENTKNFLGVNGYYNFSPTRHNGLDLKDLVMMEVRDKKFTLIE
jgi:branched-chain amino acid transport system substrate-binding protein